MTPTRLRVAVGLLVALEWLLIVVVGLFVVWAIVTWVTPGDCTGITCW
jgi:hypothetical protein